ncbi:unnamed protein product, partial [Musa acuminata subsp. burmannicoides]
MGNLWSAFAPLCSRTCIELLFTWTMSAQGYFCTKKPRGGRNPCSHLCWYRITRPNYQYLHCFLDRTVTPKAGSREAEMAASAAWSERKVTKPRPSTSMRVREMGPYISRRDFSSSTVQSAGRPVTRTTEGEAAAVASAGSPSAASVGGGRRRRLEREAGNASDLGLSPFPLRFMAAAVSLSLIPRPLRWPAAARGVRICD